MIFVVGTKRSGTSMWMQALAAAGLPIIGEAFPGKWDRSIRAANPDGFFESVFREGVYYRTNPHPMTGQYLSPERARGQAVKVFPLGLVRSDVAFIECVVGTVRRWDDYVASITRLLSMQDDFHVERVGKSPPKAGLEARLPHWAVWWLENYLLVRDIATRRHRAILLTYDHAVRAPEAAAQRVTTLIRSGDPAQALPVLGRSTSADRRAYPADEARPPDELVDVFERYYDAVDGGGVLSADLIEEMNVAFDRFRQAFSIESLVV